MKLNLKASLRVSTIRLCNLSQRYNRVSGLSHVIASVKIYKGASSVVCCKWSSEDSIAPHLVHCLMALSGLWSTTVEVADDGILCRCIFIKQSLHQAKPSFFKVICFCLVCKVVAVAFLESVTTAIA